MKFFTDYFFCIKNVISKKSIFLSENILTVLDGKDF